MMPRAMRIIGPFIVAIAGLVMILWSWGTWPDPVIDFGREAYVPWQLSEGQVLYRDIVSYFNGPLSPYTHAILFKIFGASLRVLVTFNLLLIALLVTMMYRLIVQVADHLTATVACTTFLVLFAFSQYLQTGNFNFVCPYSYDLTHGIVLAVAGITLLSRWMRCDGWIWLAGAGALLGMVALTKAEVFLAAAVGMIAGVAATLAVRRPAAGRWISTGIFAGAALVPVFLAWDLLVIALPPAEALRGMLGAWRWAADPELTSLPYFRQLAGTDHVSENIRIILIWTIGYVLFLSVPTLAAWTGMNWRILTIVLTAAVLVGGLGWWTKINWSNVIRPAPLLLTEVAILLVVLVVRRRDMRLVLPLTLVVWAAAMLAKIPLNTQILHYGFALSMPATIVLIVMLMAWLPRLIEQSGRNGWPVRAVVLASIIATCHAYLRLTNVYFEHKTVTVGTGPDRFRADARGVAVNALLRELQLRANPGDTLVSLPEGLLVNYIVRMKNPTGQLNFTPPAIIMYGETEMIRAFDRSPPEWIARFSIDSSEYGARFFGEDYAVELNRWIEQRYETQTTITSPPVMGGVLRIELLRKAIYD